MVLAGKDKGKTGKVLELFPVKSRVLVENVNIVKKHMRKKSETEQGGIKEMPASIHISNIGLVCPACGKSARFTVKTMGDKSKVRLCSRCQQSI